MILNIATQSFLQKMLEPTSGKILPVSTDFNAPEGVAIFIGALCTIMAVCVLIYALYMLMRKRDWVPMLVWLGALFFMSILENFADYNGHCYWANNLPGPAYFAYGGRVPFFIMLAYAGYSGFFYAGYRLFKRGITMKGVFYVWLFLCLTDAVFEIPLTSKGAFMYYGFSPLRIFGWPFWWSWISGTGFLMITFLLWLVVPHLKGWYKAFILLVPVTGYSFTYGIFAQPNWVALNWSMPVFLAHLLSIVSLVICLFVTWGIGNIVATDSPKRKKFSEILSANYER